jgi:hypothetical protein
LAGAIDRYLNEMLDELDIGIGVLDVGVEDYVDENGQKAVHCIYRDLAVVIGEAALLDQVVASDYAAKFLVWRQELVYSLEFIDGLFVWDCIDLLLQLEHWVYFEVFEALLSCPFRKNLLSFYLI